MRPNKTSQGETFQVHSRPLRLGNRDLEVLRSVTERACLSTSQLAELFFPSTKKASERLKELVNAGLLRQGRRDWQFAQTRTENFYSVTAAGHDQVRKSAFSGALRAINRSAVPRNLPHLAGINQFWILLQKACKDLPGLSSVFVPSWQCAGAFRLAKQIDPERSAVEVSPDAAFLLRHEHGAALLFFLEIDRRTEPILRHGITNQTSLAAKIEWYAIQFDDGIYRTASEKLFGVAPRGFRVLLVTTDAKRIADLAAACHELGDTRFVWATTFEDIARHGVFGAVWRIASVDETDAHSILTTYDRHPLPEEGSP